MSEDGFSRRNDESSEGRPPPDAGERRDDGDASLEVDTVLELLRDQRRRAVLARLHGREGEDLPLEWLAGEVADARPPVPGQRGGSGAEARRIAVSLHHVHLPRLAAAGVVDYDATERTCRYLGDERLDDLLAAVRRQPLG